jgi:hypothetical protein
MKDHILRNIINEVTATAEAFHGTGQMRAQIEEILTPILKAHQHQHAVLRDLSVAPIVQPPSHAERRNRDARRVVDMAIEAHEKFDK